MTIQVATCVFCGAVIVDGSKYSGFTGTGPDWMSTGDDFGCDKNPISGEEGVGGHQTEEEVRTIYALAADDNASWLEIVNVFGTMRERLYGTPDEELSE